MSGRDSQIIASGALDPHSAERAGELEQFTDRRAARARETVADRIATADRVLAAFRDHLGPAWLDGADDENAAWRAEVHERGQRPLPAVMIGTLCSGEHEYERCVAAVRRQSHPDAEHVVIEGRPKAEAVAALMDTFAAGDREFLVKVDADMVLLDDDFVARAVAILAANPGVDLLQMAVLDFFSGRTMQGINAYRRGFAWDPARQDALFSDRTQVAKERRLVTWAPFARSAIHAPDPSPFQAFHFGAHRGLKVRQPEREQRDEDQAAQQTTYLEQTWEHFGVRRDRRLGLACLGFELALAGEFDLPEVDYTNWALRDRFDRFSELTACELADEVRTRRAERVPDIGTEAVRARRRALVHHTDAPIDSVLFVLPHIGVFGGVNRFFELARRFVEMGVECVIATPPPPEPGGDDTPARRPDYPTVATIGLDSALARPWDVVVCGDCTAGVMLTLPLFETRLSAVYLLNGWMRRAGNARQIAAVDPDIVIANSSYAARWYGDLAPVVVPGGVDLEIFEPPAGRRHREAEPSPFRVAAYGGRLKDWKGFAVVVKACVALHKRGVPVELNVFDARPIDLDVPFAFRYHGKLVRTEVSALLRGMDAMLSGEKDAGWSNPTAEAMACGVPVACTEAGTTDFAIDGESALVAPVGDAPALAAAAERLWRDPALAERLASGGLERIATLGWPDVARTLLDVFRDARRDGRRRAGLDRRARRRLEELAAEPALRGVA
jgi:glycosyltransferase involved in cell wall biosynthesis